jgi:glycolate oxidase FAD binding subunit
MLASVAAVRDRVRDARARNVALRLAGAGTWLDAGQPVRAVEALSTRALSGIVEYVPGDLTLTARGGTSLAEIQDAAGRHGQWLALDPFGSDAGTIGATLATASYGPLATAFGTPRDLTLGVEFVTGTGIVARGGGRVVKNVAGFDLTRLIIGSWGTLGVITEVTVRLHARAPADESIAVALGNAPDCVASVRRLLKEIPFTPYAAEIVNAPLAALLLDREDAATAVLLVRLAGNTAAVQAQRRAFAAICDATPVDPDVWRRLRASEPPGAMTFRLSRPPGEIDATWRDAGAVAAACPGALVHAAPTRGVARCIVPASDAGSPAPHATLQAVLQAVLQTVLQTVLRLTSSGARPAVCIGERLPADLWPLCAPPAPKDLAGRVKAAFDPGHVLNPGIFGEVA